MCLLPSHLFLFLHVLSSLSESAPRTSRACVVSLLVYLIVFIWITIGVLRKYSQCCAHAHTSGQNPRLASEKEERGSARQRTWFKGLFCQFGSDFDSYNNKTSVQILGAYCLEFVSPWVCKCVKVALTSLALLCRSRKDQMATTLNI